MAPVVAVVGANLPSSCPGLDRPLIERCRASVQVESADCLGAIWCAIVFSTEPARRKLTARLVQKARQHKPSDGVSERMQNGIGAIDYADADCGDDCGNDRFVSIPVNSHANPADGVIPMAAANPTLFAKSP